jgi:hypothetical protein
MPISDFICRYVIRSMPALTRPRSWVSSSEPGRGVGFWGGRIRVGVHGLDLFEFKFDVDWAEKKPFELELGLGLVGCSWMPGTSSNSSFRSESESQSRSWVDILNLL